MDPTLQAAVDRSEITNLLARYALALDTRDWELLASCFAPDATFRFAHAGDVSGTEGIIAVCRRSLEPLDGSQHLVGSASIDVDGDLARLVVPLPGAAREAGLEGGGLYVVAGTYVDELRRTGAGWQIRHRELRRVWTDGNPAVLGYGRAAE